MNQFVIRRPQAVIATVLVVTVAFAFGLSRGLELDVSPLSFVARNSQERRDFADARKHFGADDYLLIAVVSDDAFSAPNLERLRKLHQKIERTSGVAEVLSLNNVPYARSLSGPSGTDGASLEKLIPESLNDEARLAEARKVATGDRLYVGNLVSADARTAALNVLLKSDLPTTTRHEITRQIYDLTRGAGFQASYFAGDPFSQWQATEALKKDLTVFLPLTVVLIALLLWLCFRSVVAVVLPLATIGVGLLWLLGLMAFFNAHFTLLALMLPTLMLAIGCSYMIHVLNQIGIAREEGERERGRDGETGRRGDGGTKTSILNPQPSTLNPRWTPRLGRIKRRRIHPSHWGILLALAAAESSPHVDRCARKECPGSALPGGKERRAVLGIRLDGYL